MDYATHINILSKKLKVWVSSGAGAVVHVISLLWQKSALVKRAFVCHEENLVHRFLVEAMVPVYPSRSLSILGHCCTLKQQLSSAGATCSGFPVAACCLSFHQEDLVMFRLNPQPTFLSYSWMDSMRMRPPTFLSCSWMDAARYKYQQYWYAAKLSTSTACSRHEQSWFKC